MEILILSKFHLKCVGIFEWQLLPPLCFMGTYVNLCKLFAALAIDIDMTLDILSPNIELNPKNTSVNRHKHTKLFLESIQFHADAEQLCLWHSSDCVSSFINAGISYFQDGSAILRPFQSTYYGISISIHNSNHFMSFCGVFSKFSFL